MKSKIWEASFWIDNKNDKALSFHLAKSVIKAGFQILSKVYQEFQPQGFTLAFVVAESHVAIHTFPENGNAYIQVSSCNEQKLLCLVELMGKKYELHNMTSNTSERR